MHVCVFCIGCTYACVGGGVELEQDFVELNQYWLCKVCTYVCVGGGVALEEDFVEHNQYWLCKLN